MQGGIHYTDMFSKCQTKKEQSEKKCQKLSRIWNNQNQRIVLNVHDYRWVYMWHPPPLLFFLTKIVTSNKMTKIVLSQRGSHPAIVNQNKEAEGQTGINKGIIAEPPRNGPPQPSILTNIHPKSAFYPVFSQCLELHLSRCPRIVEGA